MTYLTVVDVLCYFYVRKEADVFIDHFVYVHTYCAYGKVFHVLSGILSFLGLERSSDQLVGIAVSNVNDQKRFDGLVWNFLPLPHIFA